MATSTGEQLDVKKILESVPLLAGLGKSERDKLADGLKHQSFKKGDYIMKEGEEGDSFYIIISGSVEVSTEQGGKLATLRQGDYAGEQALLQSTRRNANLIAVEPTKCLVCNRTLFEKSLHGNPQIRFANRQAHRNAFLTPLKEAGDSKENKQEEDRKKLTPEQMQWLLDRVANHALFGDYELALKTQIISCFELKEYNKGDYCIRQGDVDHCFYVVESGHFDCLVDGVKVVEYKRGGTFGELALLYNQPRQASIVATEKSKAWEIHQSEFLRVRKHYHRTQYASHLEFLKKVPLFQPLLQSELERMADAFHHEYYQKGAIIFKEGDTGDRFYVIRTGAVRWSKKSGQSGELKEADLFGERALRTNEPRAATIEVTSDKCTLWELEAKDFYALLGPVVDIIDDKINSYKRSAEILQEDQELERKRQTLVEQQKKNFEVRAESKKNVCKLKDLKTIGVLGKGGFGLVTLVVDPNTNKSYALKAIKKFQVVELDLSKHIVSEKRVMDMMHNKFLVNLHATYKDKLRVYFLLDVCLGGELFTILRQKRYFNEPTSKFYAACVIEAFDYMHSMDIIYRDLKPENLVLDSDGYLKVTDFGFAKVCPDKTYTLCGTPDYLCPEIVTGQGHGKGVDWWTLGILIYEMLASFPPFVADDPVETYRKIVAGRIRFPQYFTQEVRELIRALLHSKPNHRLPCLRGGAENIRKHLWYKGFKWEALREGKMPAPIVNKVRDHLDISNFAQVDVGLDDAKPIPAEKEFDQEF